MRGNGARISHPGIALVIEELDSETGVNRGLVGIGERAGDLVQAESRQQSGLVGKAMIDPHRKLVGARVDLSKTPRKCGRRRLRDGSLGRG